MWKAAFKRLLRRKAVVASSSGQNRHSFRPQVEILETRELLAAGLLGLYYDRPRLEGTPAAQGKDAQPLRPAAQRVDGQINFEWVSRDKLPGTLENVHHDFSTVWVGEFTPRFTEAYTFYTTSDDGVRLFLDHNVKPLIDDWNDHAPKEDTSAAVRLEAGHHYSIMLEYYENDFGAAVISLSRSSAHEAKAVIPAGELSHENPSKVHIENLRVGTLIRLDRKEAAKRIDPLGFKLDNRAVQQSNFVATGFHQTNDSKNAGYFYGLQFFVNNCPGSIIQTVRTTRHFLDAQNDRTQDAQKEQFVEGWRTIPTINDRLRRADLPDEHTRTFLIPTEDKKTIKLTEVDTFEIGCGLFDGMPVTRSGEFGNVMQGNRQVDYAKVTWLGPTIVYRTVFKANLDAETWLLVAHGIDASGSAPHPK